MLATAAGLDDVLNGPAVKIIGEGLIGSNFNVIGHAVSPGCHNLGGYLKAGLVGFATGALSQFFGEGAALATPRTFRGYFMNLSPDGLVLRKYVLFRERYRFPVTENLLSAREGMPESLQEARKIGANGQYAAGQPLQEWGKSIISCVTPLGVLEFAVKPADAQVLLHYIDRLRQYHEAGPPATTA